MSTITPEPFQVATPDELAAMLHEEGLDGPIDPTSAPEWWEQRIELAAIRDYATITGAAPTAMLAAVITRVIAQTPHGVTLPAGPGGAIGSLNLLAALVGTSGGGKGTATAAAEGGALFRGGELFVKKAAGSGEGFLTAYAHKVTEEIDGRTATSLDWENRSILFDIAEVSDLGAQLGKAGSTLQGIILNAFMGAQLGFTYKSEAGLTIPRHEYRFAMLVGVQPGNGGILLGGDTATSGLPQRFLWASTDRKARKRHEMRPLSERRPITLELPYWGPGPQEVPVADEIIGEIMWEHEKRADPDMHGDALDGHRLFVQEKVAAALAFMSGRKDVRWDDWTLAQDVMAHSDLAREKCVAALGDREDELAQRRGRSQAITRMAASDAEAEARVKRENDLRALLVRLWEEAGKPSAWKPIRRKVRHASRELADKVALDLASEGFGFPSSEY